MTKTILQRFFHRRSRHRNPQQLSRKLLCVVRRIGKFGGPADWNVRATPFLAAALFLLGASIWCSAGPLKASEGGALPQPLPLFPADHWWNLDVSSWPVDPGSANYIAFINNGGTRRLHPDLGGDAATSDDPSASYGMPYTVVSGVSASDLVVVEFDYAPESDGVDHSTETSYPFYPIPPAAQTQPYFVEGGDPGNVDLRSDQDRHLLIVDYDRNYLYELYNVFFDSSLRKWFAGSGAFFDMNTNARRPDGWTSADAAGLAIFPGLIRYDEVYDPTGNEIGHAFRVTVRSTDGYVYPASHRAGSKTGALPMGARLRLKASVDVTQKTADPNMQRIFRAMQKHGLIVADNGSDMYITGTYDLRWNSDVLNPAFRALSASDFEVIQLGYNPSSETGGGVSSGSSVANLRATVHDGELFLVWDLKSPGAKYQVQSSSQLIPAPVWKLEGQTSGASWSDHFDKTSGTRFYRVFSLNQ